MEHIHEWQPIANDGKRIKSMCMICFETKDEAIKKPKPSIMDRIRSALK